MLGRFSRLVLGLALSCASPSAPESPRVFGHLLYEGNSELVPARSLRLTLRSGEDVVASSHALEPADEGRFELVIEEGVVGPLALEVEAVWISEDGAPIIAVGEADPEDSTRARRVWSWRFDVCKADCEGATALGDLVIAQSDGAGAARAFDGVVAVLERIASASATRDVDPPSVLVLWSEDVEPECGSCYLPLALGGGAVETDEGEQRYDAVIQLAPSAPWSASLVAHEASHWIMEGVSRWPGDLSVHDPSQLARPGVAYTEGWATFNGQATLEWASGQPNPVASFGAIEVDLERGTVNGEPVPPPLGSTTDDPWATETTIAAILWAIRAHAGDDAMTAALLSPRLHELERDHGRTDLIDLLDALSCEGLVDDRVVEQAAELHAYPWRSAERVCAP